MVAADIANCNPMAGSDDQQIYLDTGIPFDTLAKQGADLMECAEQQKWVPKIHCNQLSLQFKLLGCKLLMKSIAILPTHPAAHDLCSPSTPRVRCRWTVPP